MNSSHFFLFLKITFFLMFQGLIKKIYIKNEGKSPVCSLMGGLSKPQMLALWLADLSKIKLNSRERRSSSGGRRGHANVLPTS